MMSQEAKKSALRKTLLARRDALSHDMIQVCEKQVRKHLSRIPAYSEAKSVACYYATSSEVPTRRIILDLLSRGRQVCLPRIRDDSEIEFAAVDGSGDLVEAEFGIMEPSERCSACEAPELVLVPVVGVTPYGARLGRGRGHYDKFLAGYRGVSVALAFSIQVVRSIPEDPWDRRVTWVVTEDSASAT